MWGRIRTLSGLPEAVTLHTLRHSFASLAADLGFGDAAAPVLTGHFRGGVTARYTHRCHRALLKVADEVAAATSERIALPAPSVPSRTQAR
jgi:site-specific recombinase XerD